MLWFLVTFASYKGEKCSQLANMGSLVSLCQNVANHGNICFREGEKEQ